MQILEFSGEELEDIFNELFMPVISRTGPGFRQRVALQELDKDLTLSLSHAGPRSAIRTGRMAANTSEADRILFAVQVTGESRLFQNNRFAEIEAGMGFLHEASSPSEWVSQTEAQHLVLAFSRELLPLRAAEITEACGRRIDPTFSAMQMLSSYLGRLFEISDRLTAPQRLNAGRAAIDLLAMALQDVVPSVAGGDGPADVLLDMMRMHVREHLADPQLQIEKLARRHHVSVSYVYTLFERIGTTPGAYLREQRLLAARAMLSDPRHARLATSHIASAVGFVDRRTFERAFRRQYGTTPGSWRREHRHSRSAPAALEKKLPPR